MSKEKVEILKDLSDLLDKKRITIKEYELQKKLTLDATDRIANISLISKLLTPQLVALLVALLFYSPVKNLVVNANELALGDFFAVKIEKAIRKLDPQLADVLGKLSKEEIIVLLDSAKGSYSLISRNEEKSEVSLDSRFNYYESLQEKQLIDVDGDIDLTELEKMFESKTPIREDSYRDTALRTIKKNIYSTKDFSEEEKKKVENVYAALSPDGEEVYLLIVDITSEEIADLK